MMNFRKYIFSFATLLFTEKVFGFPSLFTHEEVQDDDKKDVPSHCLSGILYYDADHWTIWINDASIHAEEAEKNPDYVIEEVTPSHVTLRVRKEEGEPFVMKVLRVF
jgi:hypothetical protein